MESRIISEREFEFARRIVKLCERLWSQGPAARKIADQLLDSGTSIGANAAEAEGGPTKPDFLAKLAVSRKESWETIFWLRLAIATSVSTKEAVASELDQSQPMPIPSAVGISPAMIAKVVIRIGRRRVRHASTIASRSGTPRARRVLA